MANPTDAQLVEQARQGQIPAVTELFQRYWPAARATAYGILGDLHLAEDAASAAMGAALQVLIELKEDAKFGPWLHTIVVRTARRLRGEVRRRREAERHKGHRVETSFTPASPEQRELIMRLHEAVEQLPELQREAVTLFYFEGYTVEQAAAFVDVPVGTLKRRLHEGRKGLRGLVQQIAGGRRPMDAHRQAVLKQLEALLHEDVDLDREHVREVILQAIKLRPYPRDLMARISRQHFAKEFATPESRAKAGVAMKKMMTILGKPSRRMTDPNHPLCQVAEAIKTALPIFTVVDFWGSQAHADEKAEQLINCFRQQGDTVTDSAKPPGTYLYHTRTLLFKDDEGKWLNTRQWIQLHDPPPDLWPRAGLSDVFVLHWFDVDSLDLHTMEQCLRDLAVAVVPEATFSVQPYDSPQCRSGLRMQFDGSTLPAALGGIAATDSDSDQGPLRGSMILCLEAWASAWSGQAIELEDATPYKYAMKPS